MKQRRFIALMGLLVPILVTPSLALAAAPPAKPAPKSAKPAAKPAVKAAVKPAEKPAACIWAATTENTRDAMMARAPGLDAILGPITDDQAQGFVTKCHLPAGMASMVKVGQVLRAYTLMNWTTGQFVAKYGVDQAALDEQWPSLPAATKKEFASAFTPAFKASDAAYAGLDVMRNKLSLSEDIGVILFDYVAARAVIEGLDGAGAGHG